MLVIHTAFHTSSVESMIHSIHLLGRLFAGFEYSKLSVPEY